MNEMPSTLEARLAQWEQARENANRGMLIAREWLDNHPVTHPQRKVFVMRWNESLSRWEQAKSEIMRIEAAKKVRAERHPADFLDCEVHWRKSDHDRAMPEWQDEGGES
jgi:hypothetical protein